MKPEKKFKTILSPEGDGTMYLDTDDNLRLIFRSGKYEGWYNPELQEVLS